MNREGVIMRKISAIKIIFLVLLPSFLFILHLPLTCAQDASNEIAALSKENAKLKDQIFYMQNGIVNLDKARKAAEETNRALTSRMAELQDRLQSAKKEQPVDKRIRDLKEEINALQVEREGYIERKKALDSQLKKALTDFDKNSAELKRLKSETALMHYNLGVIFQKANKWQDAIREYSKVLEIMPNDADTNFNLALIYEMTKNDRDKAVYYYQKYLEANPTAEDTKKVKEHITNMNAEDRVWGEPRLGGIKEKTGRLW